jgi:hypothetical protein
LSCRGLDDIEVDQLQNQKLRTPVVLNDTTANHYRRRDVYELLKAVRVKELLVVQLEKPVMWEGPSRVQSILRNYVNWVSNLGYRRVLILGSHSSGIFVMYDSEEKPE